MENLIRSIVAVDVDNIPGLYLYVNKITNDSYRIIIKSWSKSGEDTLKKFSESIEFFSNISYKILTHVQKDIKYSNVKFQYDSQLIFDIEFFDSYFNYIPMEIMLTISSYLDHNNLNEFMLSGSKLFIYINNNRNTLYKLKFGKEQPVLFNKIIKKLVDWEKLYNEIKTIMTISRLLRSMLDITSLSEDVIINLNPNFLRSLVQLNLNYSLDIFFDKNIIGESMYKDVLFNSEEMRRYMNLTKEMTEISQLFTAENFLDYVLTYDRQYFEKVYHMYDEYSHLREYPNMFVNVNYYLLGLHGNLKNIKLLHSNKYVTITDDILEGAIASYGRMQHVVLLESEYNEVIEWVLENINISINALNEGFITAITIGNTHAVKLLLQNPNVDPTRNNNESMYIAINRLRPKIVKLLLEDGRINPSYNNNYYYLLLKSLITDEKQKLEEIGKLLKSDPRFIKPYNILGIEMSVEWL